MKKKKFPFQNGGQKRISISRKQPRDQNFKTTFPKEFFNKIWLKVGENEYIYIFKWNLKKKICLEMAAKTIFVTSLNSANLCWLEWKWHRRWCATNIYKKRGRKHV